VETVPGAAHSSRLHIRDPLTGRVFLIDTGADISLLPAHPNVLSDPPTHKLFAANNSCIKAFGETLLAVDLGLRRRFLWNFCIADVSNPIIGADFLSYYNITVDLRSRRILDSLSGISSSGYCANAHIQPISAIAPNTNCRELLALFPEICGSSQPDRLASCDVQHHILTTGPPVSERPRKLAPDKLRAAKAEFQTWLEAGICRPSSSPWASPMHMTRKKDGSWRICGDYRRLNSVTLPDKYPTANLQDFSANLHGKKVFSGLDLHRAFNQIPVAPSDIEKTAITTPFGSFEFLFMTFGLRNASQSFQRFINRALGDLNFVYIYIDDILVASSSYEEHNEHLKIVFQRLKDFHLRLNVEKCIFAVDELDFLGYTINSQGFRPTKTKVDAILHYPKPQTFLELRRFLGMVNFYRKNIPHAAESQASLNALFIDSRKNDKRPIPWTQQTEQAFEKVRAELANAALLVHPRSGAKLRLITDASDYAMGAVLEQQNENEWDPLAFFSRKFTAAQCNYSAYDRELTAIFEAIKYFSHFLEAAEFQILTDHKPLVYAFAPRSEKASPRQTRQLAYITQFSTKIEYIRGTENPVADSLSRVEAIRLPTEFSLVELSAKQVEDNELKIIISSEEVPLKLRKLTFEASHSPIFCEVSEESIRPYIPANMRKNVFDFYHNSAHPGARVTDRIIRQHYVWPNMHRDITRWAKQCINCQQAKISRHSKLIPDKFVAPDGRFDHVHLDIVGPLPNIEGYQYILTMIDRFSRWIEAVALKETSAATVARTFHDTWITRYGAPKLLTTDQGSNFESQFFTAYLSLIGCERLRTTAYHPASNGIIERWHRTFKTALMCHADTNWLRTLSTVLLGLRTAIRLDTDAAPVEFMFGTPIRIPGEFFLPEDITPDPNYFIEDYRTFMRQVRPVPAAHNNKNRAFIFKDLPNCKQVFLRNVVRKALERPYSGPFTVLERISDRVYKILNRKGEPQNVSVELLKPAFTVSDNIDCNSTNSNLPNTSRSDFSQFPPTKTYARKSVRFSKDSNASSI